MISNEEHVIHSVAELEQWGDKLRKHKAAFTKSVRICIGTGCVARGANKIYEMFCNAAEKSSEPVRIEAKCVGCHGFCERGPIVVIQPDEILYQGVEESDVEEIFHQSVLGNNLVERLLYQDPNTGERAKTEREIPFYNVQQRVVLAGNGVIDPTNIEDYIVSGGYAALAKALTSMEPEEIIAEVKNSGLRGRGGAGFLTGLKWQLCRQSDAEPKYIICNGDEGDPGAFMDRSIMEGNPHSVLEGMIIGAYAIGASHGFLYVRNEYPLAVKHLRIAIKQARKAGFLGENILDTDLSFDISMERGAGAFICGEETSLISSLEGNMPEPRVRPPYPAQSGYAQQPTNINNVETWANVRHIINNGAQWFHAMGTEKSKGTKVFSLVGKVKNTGLIEIPMGTTLRRIIFEIGEGLLADKPFKAVQTGGPSGGCIPASLLDLPVDYESLAKVGSIVGSGGMIVLDEDNCMVEVARYFLTFTQGESCGKCAPCREGTRHMLDILTNITEGKGEEGDIEVLEKMATLIKQTALCALGNTAPNPVLTTIKYFREEYEAHIRDKKCPAKQCKALIQYLILEDKCTGCTACARNCPVNAISGERKKVHLIDQEVCIKCGLCYTVCKFDAVRVES